MPQRPRPAPEATPETQHFWDGTKRGELLLQKCDDCAKVYFPPRPFCPGCASKSVSVLPASGKARLFSYVINYRQHPSFDGPYAIAVVELEEGPRMMTNIVECPQTPEALVLDMPVEVTFESVNDAISVPLFKPVEGT